MWNGGRGGKPRHIAIRGGTRRGRHALDELDADRAVRMADTQLAADGPSDIYTRAPRDGFPDHHRPGTTMTLTPKRR
jgi:hypothetical protein